MDALSRRRFLRIPTATLGLATAGGAAGPLTRRLAARAGRLGRAQGNPADSDLLQRLLLEVRRDCHGEGRDALED